MSLKSQSVKTKLYCTLKANYTKAYKKKTSEYYYNISLYIICAKFNTQASCYSSVGFLQNNVNLNLFKPV